MRVNRPAVSVSSRSRFRACSALFLALFLVPGGGFSGRHASAQEVSLEELDALHFRHIGPVGNRVISVAGVEDRPLVYYAGAASGGLWKTVDGGLTWDPIFDDQEVHSVGSVAVAPSDPSVVWAGTGEHFIRSNVSIGDGVYKSVDGGETWRHMGLEETGRISRIVIHPDDPQVVYVASLGHGYRPQEERGVFRTRNGGETWEKVLFVNDSTGASDLLMDPSRPRVLYAGMWQIDIKTWGRWSGGPGSGIYRSNDGGETWSRLEGGGLPRGPLGKIALCSSRERPERIYALIETGDGVPGVYRHVPGGEDVAAGERSAPTGELWRTDDGGDTWHLRTHNRDLGGRQAYYTRCTAAPDDPDEVYFMAAAYSKTIDGGRTHEVTQGARRPTWDSHEMWIDPDDGDRQIVVGDGGIAISENRGETWHRIQLPLAQMYHVTVDNAIPYHVLGNRQDGPSTRGPSRSRTGGFFGSGIPRGMWHAVGGGESGWATPDPTDPNLIWSSASGAGARGGIVTVFNEETRHVRQVEVWPESTGGWPEKDLEYRFQWTFPLVISPHDPNTVYVTSQHVHRTTNRGQSWEVISPDLTTNDTTKMTISGGLTPDNIGVEYCCVIYAFDESPVQEGLFWAGTNDGLVWLSRDGGENWTEVTERLPDLPPDGVVRGIDASRHDAGTAYLAVEHHQVGNFEPHVYRTRDFGETWTKITDGIDDHTLSYARWIHEDPVRPGLLYLGTENKLYVSFDDGERWRSLMTNLPPAPIYGIVVQEHFNDLVIGTYGRGFWILDDISPLQQLTEEVAARDAHLFEPRPTYRFHPITSPMTMFDDWSAGENPPRGAAINYWLGTRPGSEVEVRIRNESGEVIRTLEGTSEEGLNRLWWDLYEEESAEIRYRARPLHAEWVEVEEAEGRPGGGGLAILAPPGRYTVELAVDGELHTRELELRKDPNSEGSLADIEAQTTMLRELRADLERAVGMVNRIEWIRKRIDDVRTLLGDETGTVEVEDGEGLGRVAERADSALIQVESELVQLRLTGTGQDGVRWPTRLVGRLGHLANAVASADFPPPDQHREVQEILEERLRRIEGELERALGNEVAEFDLMLRDRGLAPAVSDPF